MEPVSGGVPDRVRRDPDGGRDGYGAAGTAAAAYGNRAFIHARFASQLHERRIIARAALTVTLTPVVSSSRLSVSPAPRSPSRRNLSSRRMTHGHCSRGRGSVG